VFYWLLAGKMIQNNHLAFYKQLKFGAIPFGTKEAQQLGAVFSQKTEQTGHQSTVLSIIVDAQNDFFTHPKINYALGPLKRKALPVNNPKETKAQIAAFNNFIQDNKGYFRQILTQETHPPGIELARPYYQYEFNTLPICIQGTKGWQLIKKLKYNEEERLKLKLSLIESKPGQFDFTYKNSSLLGTEKFQNFIESTPSNVQLLIEKPHPNIAKLTQYRKKPQSIYM